MFVLNMLSPFVEDFIDEEAWGLTRGQCQEMILRLDVLSFPDDDLFFFTLYYLHNLMHNPITNITQMLLYLGLIY